MSTGTALLAALESLDQTVASIETTMAKLEARPRTGGKRRDNQMDLFSAPSPTPSAVPTQNFDTEDVTRRLNRAIAQIETALSAA